MEKQDLGELKEKEETPKNLIKSCFSMVTKWFETPLVRNAIIISGLFALIIHILYSIPAPFEFLVHKWEAGDILTYVSTIALSLLAVWQNQKFKEENDKAQETMERQNNEAQARLERINIEANELSIISRIIDQENQYLIRLEKSAHIFLEVTSMSRLRDAWDKANSANNPLQFTLIGDEMKHTYDRLTSVYLTGMRAEGTDLLRLMESFGDVYEKASKFYISIISDGKVDYSFIEANVPVVAKADNALESFLFERRRLIHRVLTEKMSLEQVRAIYGVFEGSIDVNVGN